METRVIMNAFIIGDRLVKKKKKGVGKDQDISDLTNTSCWVAY